VLEAHGERYDVADYAAYNFAQVRAGLRVRLPAPAKHDFHSFCVPYY
jgi:hypothetical protein